MKKFLCLMTAFIMIFAVSSCGGGKSIPTDLLKSGNRVSSLISNETLAFSEKIEYFGDETLTYSVYTEAAAGFAYNYNIVEKIGDYTLYVHEGEIYSEKDGKICSVVLSNPAYTFAGFVGEYLDADFPLDSGVRYQRSSNEDSQFTYVTYYAEITPQMASSIYSAKLKAGEKIITTYKLGKGYRIYQADYGVENSAGEITPVARRTFEYFTKRNADIFSSLPDNDDKTYTLTLVYSNRSEERKIKAGTDIGFDDGGAGYEYFSDKEMTVPFSQTVSSDITVYVKTNFD